MSILGSNQVFTKATFNYFEASCLVMDALGNFRGNQDICQLAIQLCANLCAKLTKEEKFALGSEKNIMTMFNIIQEKISARQEDLTLSNAFTVLKELTEETPSTCSLFVEKGGFQLMVQGLKVFREGSQEKNFGIKNDLLMELNIIAEVPSLRHLLITDEFMNLIGSLLDDGLLQLSYFCGGILSNVMLEWSDDRELLSYSKQYLLHRLEQAVKSWEFPTDKFVGYQSFRSFVPLLLCAMPAAQMWALWGIINVCISDSKHHLISNCLNSGLANKQLRQDDAFDFCEVELRWKPLFDLIDCAHINSYSPPPFHSFLCRPGRVP
ncbi:protein zyg-11 homolog [Pocillopora damicornis]|uniref:protein zyg-11 homolog n=1 Tax=Pocillopora damicornis TaxID=46731 RepID=UPI000F54E79F|nr:protein zyg-11 homolog [Pocillopora damicornis]